MVDARAFFERHRSRAHLRAANPVLIHLLAVLCFDYGEPFDPSTEVICENDRTTPSFHSPQFAAADRRIKARPSDARYLARFCDVVGKWRIHGYLTTGTRDDPDDPIRILANVSGECSCAQQGRGITDARDFTR